MRLSISVKANNPSPKTPTTDNPAMGVVSPVLGFVFAAVALGVDVGLVVALARGVDAGLVVALARVVDVGLVVAFADAVL